MMSGSLLACPSLILGLLLTAHCSAAVKVIKQDVAAQVVVAQGVIIALDHDLEHVMGFDASGKMLWRTRYQAKGEGRGVQALFAFDGHVLVYAGDRQAALGHRPEE